ncbi:MAG: porin [Hyphomicrobiales bacterium]
MKKILLATSALVAMSSVAVAGDIPAAPVAPLVAGWTVTATGSATIFGFYNQTGTVALGTQYGIGGDFEASLKAAKTLDDGSDVYVKVVADKDETLEALVGYKSAIGEFKAGAVGGKDEHDVEVPGAAGIPNIGDELEDGDKGLTFASADLSKYVRFNAAAVLTGAVYSVTYATPVLGGFQAGFGVDGDGSVDLAVAGSFDVSGATVKVGAGYIATAVALDKGVAKVGASVAVAGFTIGGDFAADLATSANNNFTAGVGYATGPFTVAAQYAALANNAGKGVITAGVRYKENGVDAIVDGSYDLNNTTGYKAAAGATYTFTDITVGATVLFDNGAANKVSASAGVDYAISSNVSVGAGVGYNGADFGAAAGLKVSF